MSSPSQNNSESQEKPAFEILDAYDFPDREIPPETIQRWKDEIESDEQEESLPPLFGLRDDLKKENGRWTTPSGFSVRADCPYPQVYDAAFNRVDWRELPDEIRKPLIQDLKDIQFREFGGVDYWLMQRGEPFDQSKANFYRAAVIEKKRVNFKNMTLTDEPAKPVKDIATKLGDLQAPNPEDGSELIKKRFLCRRGSLMVVGPTGAGKSSLGLQMAVLWGIGEAFFGLKPKAPLRSLIIQAENDEGDLWEMRDGIFKGCNLTAEQIEMASKNVTIASINDCIGIQFIARAEVLIKESKPDLFFCDPLLAYIGGDISRQEVCSQFLRSWLTPIITNANCAAVILHHPPKPIRESGVKNQTDDAYYGAGSSDLFNWSRAVIALKPKNKSLGIYNLVLAKRGRRAGWLESDNETYTCERSIGHGEHGLIYWRDVDSEEAQSASSVGKTKEDVLLLVPMSGKILKNTLITKSQAAGIGANNARSFIDELIECELVYLSTQKRSGTSAAKYISRKQDESTDED